MEAALGFVHSRPATVTAFAGLRAVRATDRRVALLMERVHRQIVLADVGPDVVVRPVGERIRLPELVAVVPSELRRIGPCRRLVAANPRDPAAGISECSSQRLDLPD